MQGPASLGGVDVAALGGISQRNGHGYRVGLGGEGGVGYYSALGANSGAGFMLTLKGCATNRARCIVCSAHQGPRASPGPIAMHVAIRTGHPGGGIYPMGLCRESAEDVEQPTEFLLKAHH
jgi:hypothetical protein